MQQVYRETRFHSEQTSKAWPERYVIITAWPPLHADWSEARILAAEAQLRASLKTMDGWMHRLTGYSPRTGHAELGWAVEIDSTHGVELGRKLLQDAIFLVEDDLLWVVDCDEEAAMTGIGHFREGFDAPGESG